MVSNSKNKFRLIVTLLLCTFAGIAFSLNYLRNIAGKVRESKIKVAEINRDISLLDKIALEKNQYTTDIQKVKNTLPFEYYQVSFFTTQLERLAQNNSLNLEIDIEDKKTEETTTIDSVSYALEAKGSYSSVSNFLSQISKLPFHTSLERMEVAQKEGELITKISFKLYVEK